MNLKRRLGQHLIDSLRDALDGIENGRPMRQSVVRRMKVKGETVYTRETYLAPVVPAPSADDAAEKGGGT